MPDSLIGSHGHCAKSAFLTIIIEPVREMCRYQELCVDFPARGPASDFDSFNNEPD